MTKRKLTDADRAAAQVLKEAIETCGLSHGEIAARVGVTVGMIHQWTKPLRPVALERAPVLAKVVGIPNPGTISVAFAEFVKSIGIELFDLRPDIRAWIGKWDALDDNGKRTLQEVGDALAKQALSRTNDHSTGE